MLTRSMIPRIQNQLIGFDQFLRDLEAEWDSVEKNAHREGYVIGKAEGHAAGFQLGRAEGYEQGYHDGLRAKIKGAANEEELEDVDPV